jgi:isoamyl acetate esterase
VIENYAKRFPTAPPILVTIWLGANDAVLPPSFAHVPIEQFEAHIKHYVDTIKAQPGWGATKILLITPPPINIMAEDDDAAADGIDIGPSGEQAMQEEQERARQGIAHRTWLSKRAYAERVRQIAKTYKEQGSSNVDLLDVWTILIETALKQAGRIWNDDKLPGCGLPGSGMMPHGWFTDGLHFGSDGYKVITAALLEKCREIDALARVFDEGKET